MIWQRPLPAPLTIASTLTWLASCVIVSPSSAADRPIDGMGVAAGDAGAAGTAFQRISTAAYTDGIAAPAGETRPNPREVSNAVVAGFGSLPNARGGSDFMWQWGQFVDHDVTLALPKSGEQFPIPVPAGDPLFDPFNTGTQTIALERSVFDLATGTGIGNPRQQLNANTSFLDASMVYGSDLARASVLRAWTDGRLATSPGDLLPFNTAGQPNETLHIVPEEEHYLAGDVRANEQPGLISMHTIFMREHNRVAGELAAANPGWTDEQLYQRARKVVGATVQSITYNEWLPALLGPSAPDPSTFSYDAGANPAMANEFSTALFRLGHTLVSPELMRLDETGAPAPGGPISLKDAFFDPRTVDSDEELEFIVRGLASQHHQEVDNAINENMRNFLFGPPGAGGMDLAALNIQRAREHGLPDYNTLRVSLGLDPVEGFDEITSDAALQAALASVYDDVDEIDPWIGALAEDHLPGATVGELIAAGFVWQFTQLAEGDPFFYLWDEDLTPEERAMLTDTSLAEVLMRNTAMTDLQSNVFFAVPEPGTVGLLAFGAGAAALLGRRRRAA